MSFKLTMKVGGRQSRFSDETVLSTAANQFTQLLLKEIKDEAAKFTVEKGRKVAKALSRLGRKENGKVFRIISELTTLSQNGYPSTFLDRYTDPVVANASFTSVSKSGQIRLPFQGKLTWVKQHPRTPRRKREEIKIGTLGVQPDSVNKYFYRTGALRRYFRNNAESLGNALGDIQVYFQDTRGRFISGKDKSAVVATLSVSFARNVKRSTLPGFLAGDWKIGHSGMAFERSIISDEEVLQKLEGPPSKHRPLVQPVVNYFLLFRFPRLISATIDNEIRKK